MGNNLPQDDPRWGSDADPVSIAAPESKLPTERKPGGWQFWVTMAHIGMLGGMGFGRRQIAPEVGISMNTLEKYISNHRDLFNELVSKGKSGMAEMRAGIEAKVRAEYEKKEDKIRAKYLNAEQVIKAQYQKELEKRLGRVLEVRDEALDGEDLALANSVANQIENRLMGTPKATLRHEGQVEAVHYVVPAQLLERVNQRFLTEKPRELPPVDNVIDAETVDA